MSIKTYIVENAYKVSQGIACAVLVCLGVGLLLQTIGSLLDWIWLQKIGFASKFLFIPALGLAIAMVFKSNSVILLCAGIAALLGSGAIEVSDMGALSTKGGEPIGAILAALVTIWVGKRIAGKTNFDMILTPIIALVIGGLVGLASAELISPILSAISQHVGKMFVLSPIISSALVGLIFAFLILSPTSSAALAIAFSLDPIASAAALIGCSVQFTAFAFLGIKENSWGAFFAQLICTPKLQTPNIIRKPYIAIIPLILSTLLSPIGVVLLGIVSVNEVAGLGLCAMVAPLYMLSNQGLTMLIHLLVITIMVPGILCLLIRPIVIRLGWLKSGDLTIG